MTLDPTPMAGPIAVTLATVLLYYAFMIQQARVKLALSRSYAARGEKFDRYFTPDREMLAADRTVLNLLEHLPPFLVLLWLNAVYVGPRPTTIAGAIYVAARVLYPFLLGGRLGRGVPTRIFLATFTGYAVIAWYAVALGYALLR
jgi:hypothetical protein